MRLVRFLTAPVMVATFGMIAGSVSAQQTTEGTTQVPGKIQSDVKQTQDATKAANSVYDPGKPVTYADVLKNPDDLALNYQWAKTQIGQGNLTGAASTLERILLNDPDLDDVRLTYAFVLYRLDNLGEARKEFVAVSKRNLDPLTRSQVNRYIKEIDQKNKRLKVDLNVAFGPGYDSNPGYHPNKDRVLRNDQEVKIGEKKDTMTLAGMANIDATYDLGMEAGHEVFASINNYGQRVWALEELDLLSHSIELGGRYRFEAWDRPWTYQPSYKFSYLHLGDKNFYLSHAYQNKLSVQYRRDIELRAELDYTHDDLFANGGSPGNGFDGPRWDAAFGGHWDVTTVDRVGLTYTSTIKQAEKNYNEYVGYRLSGNYRRLLGAGTFVLANAEVGVRDYSEEQSAKSVSGTGDANISSKLSRLDNYFTVGATYGIPIGNLIPKSWGLVESYPMIFEDLVGLHSIQATVQDSNIQDYRYTRLVGSAMINKTFRF